ncbi:MAG: hypothetical protein GY851_16130 [bacterium]|nr:hypothetical protein [bacterium]
MRLHPSRQDLMAHAEALEGGHRISAEMARHLSHCATCTADVEGMRQSLQFVASAPALEPRSQLTNQILAAARSERRAERRAHSRVKNVVVVAKGLAFAAGLVIVSTMSFRTALGDSSRAGANVFEAVAVDNVGDSASQDALLKAASEVRTFAAAVGAREFKPSSVEEWCYARTVLAVNADLTAVRAALQLNPDSERANQLMSANLHRQAQALKTLYVERSL